MTVENRKKISRLIPQVIVLFVIGILVTGSITYITQRSLSDSSIRVQTEKRASEISEEVTTAILEYPAYEWLLSYWFTHCNEMDIEYDALFGSGTETEAKCMLLEERYPSVQLRYATLQDIETMDEEDQKLYAEIIYSWLITRLDQIKSSYHIDYLFCVVSDEDYETQIFLLSAAAQGETRGPNYGDVYPIGKTVTVSPDQQEAMHSARENSSYLANAGDYADYYTYLCEIQGHPSFIGMTYSLSDIRSSSALQARRETLYAMLYQIFLSLICLFLIYSFVLRPLRKVQQNIQVYKQTKDSAAIKDDLTQIKARNEIGDLAKDVTDLTTEIDDYISRIETITAEEERISTELSLATRIQTAMLPHTFPPFPERREFDIYAIMDPAKEVGGDFYDFFMVDDDHIAIVIADVSGKGVPAALFMMASRITLQSYAMQGGSPAQILANTNESIFANNPEEMFVTAWLGILEISTGRIKAANAGHEYPALQKTPGGPFELIKDKHGFVIGGLSGMTYTDYELEMEPGTRIFIYTDGVPDAADADNKMFGTDRMLEALNKDIYASPEQTLQNIKDAVDGFVKDAEQFDDLTMLCLEYKGKAMEQNEIDIEADTQNLSRVQDFVTGCLDTSDCPLKTRMEIEVCVEEIFVNIASYAYAPGTGRVKVMTEVSDDPARISITFTDKGVPYDPLEREDPDITLNAEERDIGGLGVFMTKKLMDQVTYEYKDGCNILKLVKYL